MGAGRSIEASQMKVFVLIITRLLFRFYTRKTLVHEVLLGFSDDDIVALQSARKQSFAVQSLQILIRAHEDYAPGRLEHQRIAYLPYASTERLELSVL